ncbi:MAG: hypothetical protein PVH87_06585 [Desulfobacteraceae bacterium]|jgi:exodeoxyribonuclease V alpha subunit
MRKKRNLIYTGITRAKQLAVLAGAKQAIAMAVKNSTPRQRHTRLALRLREWCGGQANRRISNKE